MCNLLTSEIGNEDKLKIYLAQARKMEIGCAQEDINLSGLEFKISKIETASKKVKMGLIKPLTGLKGVGAKAVKNIVENQPYKNLEGFLRKIDARVVNVRVFKTLVEAGCMDSWGVSQDNLIKQYDIAKKKLEKERRVKQKQNKELKQYGEGSLFDDFDYSGSKLNI
jgi:DNA polymerase-3 subunit alpha